MIPIEVSKTEGGDVVEVHACAEEAFGESAGADAGVDEQHAAGCTHDGCVPGRPAGKNAEFQSDYPLETWESGGAFFEEATRTRQTRAAQHFRHTCAGGVGFAAESCFRSRRPTGHREPSG